MTENNDGHDRSGEQNAESPVSGDSGQGESPGNLSLEAVNEIVTKAVTSHLRRVQRDFSTQIEALKSAPEPSQPEAPDEGAKGQGKAGEVEALRQRLQAIEAERSSEREHSAQQTRDLALRQAIEGTGTHRVEHMFRYMKGDTALNVGQDGAYYATDQHGGHMELGDWARSVFQADAAWRPASGRGGGGGAPQGGGASASSSSAMTREQYRTKLAALVESDDASAMQRFQMDVANGAVIVEGING
jgi:hypothetical protein